MNVHRIPTFELPSSCHKRSCLLKMTRNWKTGLTLAFTGKIYFRILGLGLACLWPWTWPWLTGLGLDTSGLVNIPAVFTCINCIVQPATLQVGRHSAGFLAVIISAALATQKNAINAHTSRMMLNSVCTSCVRGTSSSRSPLHATASSIQHRGFPATAAATLSWLS